MAENFNIYEEIPELNAAKNALTDTEEDRKNGDVVREIWHNDFLSISVKCRNGRIPEVIDYLLVNISMPDVEKEKRLYVDNKDYPILVKRIKEGKRVWHVDDKILANYILEIFAEQTNPFLQTGKNGKWLVDKAEDELYVYKEGRVYNLYNLREMWIERLEKHIEESLDDKELEEQNKALIHCIENTPLEDLSILIMNDFKFIRNSDGEIASENDDERMRGILAHLKNYKNKVARELKEESLRDLDWNIKTEKPRKEYWICSERKDLTGGKPGKFFRLVLGDSGKRIEGECVIDDESEIFKSGLLDVKNSENIPADRELDIIISFLFVEKTEAKEEEKEYCGCEVFSSMEEENAIFKFDEITKKIGDIRPVNIKEFKAICDDNELEESFTIDSE